MEQKEDRPAYATFHRVAVEDLAQSREQGRYVARDVDMAHITPPYSKDVYKIKVEQWFANLRQDVANGRIPREWLEAYQKSYAAWKNGQEMPLSGTAIRGWGVISPAQQEMLIRMNVLTVEDLAAINDEGMKRVGMGALDLKSKAKAWLAQLEGKGPLTQKMAAMESENRTLKESVDSLQRQVEALMKKETVKVSVGDDISSPELLETDERNEARMEYEKLYGKPPHHLMKTDTILRRIKEKR